MTSQKFVWHLMVQRAWNAWNMNEKNTFVHFVEPNVSLDFQGFNDWQRRWMRFVRRLQIWNRRFAEKVKTRLLMKGSNFVISRAVLHANGVPDKLEIFVTNPLCPSRSLQSSLPCHHLHHHRRHYHFLAYTRPQQFPTLVLGSPLSRTLPISFLAVCDLWWELLILSSVWTQLLGSL